MSVKDKSIIAEDQVMPSILAYHPTISVQTADGPFLVSLLLPDWISNAELFAKIRRATGCKTWGELLSARFHKAKLKSQEIEAITIVKSDRGAQLMAGSDTPI
jgi:hypothetical protein